jgi:hypothetical protein
MIDDPLALAVQVIAVLAAGMYPVGFMFGVCSDCCGCPPCGRCTHYEDTNGTCPNSDGDGNNWIWDVDWSYTVEGIGTATAENVPFFPEPAGAGNLYISDDDLPAIPQDVIDRFNAYQADSNLNWSASATAHYFYGPEWSDSDCGTPQECSCGCLYTIRLRATFRFFPASPFVQDFTTTFEKCFRGTLNECDETTITLSPTTPWTRYQLDDDPANEPNGNGDVYAVYAADDSEEFISVSELLTALLEWLDDHPATEMTLSGIEPCECGACCEDDGEVVICSDNVAEGACPGDWQGVDTLCEDVTCGGTCCDAAPGDCTYTREDQCDGAWTSGGSCDPNPCSQPAVGACCDGGNCTQTTQLQCDELWGTWSEGVECDPNPC